MKILLHHFRVMCLLLLCGTASMVAAQNKFEKVDREAKSIPEAYTYSIDSLASYIDGRFTGDENKIRAVYIWMVNNLRYNMYTTFVSRNEEVNELQEMTKTLRTREGICRQFALIFRALAEKVGIPAYVVGGYNKSRGVLLPDPHEWCVAKIGSSWKLYDPTFGMGYVSNYQFVSSPNTTYFQLPPQVFINSHMPFDPIWQLLDRPYSYTEFDNSFMDNQRQVATFNYKDSIRVYLSQNRLQQLTSINQRVLAHGKGNRLVEYFTQLTQANILAAKKGEVYGAYQGTIKCQNQAVDLLNQFIEYRNAKFKPKKKEKEIRQMVAAPETMVLMGDSLIHTIQEIPPQYATAIINLRKSIMELTGEIFKQKIFVERYYATPKSERKALLFLK